MKIVNSFRNSLLLALFVSLTFILQGCSVHPVASEMVPEKIQIVKQHPYTVSLEVRADEGDGFLEPTLIKALDLQGAIESSINQSGLFTKVVQGGADFCLEVNADVNAPSAGFNHTVIVGGEWRLLNCTDKKIVMNEFVTESFTATVGDALVGITRVRLAISGAAKKFVLKGLTLIGKIDF